MREIVHIQGGQCGNQIGAKFWEVSQCVKGRLIPFSHLTGARGGGAREIRCFWEERCPRLAIFFA